KNTVIIMTSNVGSHFLMEGVTDKGEIKERARNEVMAELRRGFRPEFLNRVDDIVLFKPLTLAEIKEIISLLTLDLSRRLKDRRIELRISDSARDFIAQAGFDPVYGARPLKRYLQHQLETRIGRALISGSIPDGSTILVDVQDGDLVVNHSQ
ncbi:MAG: AAA domain-containing protein, partial [Syntrophobacteraceae bacterium]|nr:AAA domain-containing protein [Syntrophobacteraceae bacterium]